MGCFTCKRKKIKCDETKWVCKRCTNSRLECRWPEKVLEQYRNNGAETPHEIGAMKSDSVSDKLPPTYMGHGSTGDTLTDNLLIDNSPIASQLGKSIEALSSQQYDCHRYEQSTRQMLGPPLTSQEMLDCEFLNQFSQRFLPAIAQMHFHEETSRLSLVLSGAGTSDLLRNIFVACGATMVAYEDPSYKRMALQRYRQALTSYLNELKGGGVDGTEDWFLVAVQVLQTLCYRDVFASANATRAATHFGAAYRFISLRIFSSSSKVAADGVKILRLDLLMVENFIFNYSVTIMFCDHKQLPHLVMNPYVMFSQTNARLRTLYQSKGYPQLSMMSMLAFLVAAKCSWLCRLCLPLSNEDRVLLAEVTLLSEVSLLSLGFLGAMTTSVTIKKTVSVAKIMLHASRILLGKMTSPDFNHEKVQEVVDYLRDEISQPHNVDTILPVWALLIGGSASVRLEDREFFRKLINSLLNISCSQIVRQVANHLEKMWMLYSGLEPLEALLNTQVMDNVCK